MTTRTREDEIERGSALEGLRFRLVQRRRHEHRHAAHALLCLRGERQCRCRAVHI